MFVVYSLDYYSDHPPMSAVRRLLEMMPGAAKFSYVPLVYFIYNVELWIQWHFYFEGRTLSYSSQTAVSVLDQLITKLILSFFFNFFLWKHFIGRSREWWMVNLNVPWLYQVVELSLLQEEISELQNQQLPRKRWGLFSRWSQRQKHKTHDCHWHFLSLTKKGDRCMSRFDKPQMNDELTPASTFIRASSKTRATK